MVSRKLKWLTGGLEALWGIPLLGGMMVIGLYWTPLMLMFVFHIISLIFAVSEGKKRTGHILGIVTSLVGWIPFVGMVMHIVTATFLLVEAAKNE